jgi:hypothetical protein
LLLKSLAAQLFEILAGFFLVEGVEQPTPAEAMEIGGLSGYIVVPRSKPV